MATTKILSFFIIFICLANTIISSDFQIPFERNQYTALTTYQEMITFLRALDKSSDNVKIEVIGQSVEGRDLVALFFSVEKQFAKKREEKPVILLFCQQHGDEPSSKEAAMFLSRELIENRNYLLKNLDLILVPQVNPDGSERRQRKEI
jgi:murein tripeptide amidase MpaA